MSAKLSSNRKILIIVENLPVPFDTRVWKEACALRDAGYAVSVLSPRGKKYTQGYELLEGVHIYRHPTPREGKARLVTSGNTAGRSSGSFCTHGGYSSRADLIAYRVAIRPTTSFWSHCRSSYSV